MTQPHPCVPLDEDTIPLCEQLDQARLDLAAAQDIDTKISVRNRIGGLTADLWKIARNARTPRSDQPTAQI